MASEKRKLTLSKETLRTLSATALSQELHDAALQFIRKIKRLNPESEIIIYHYTPVPQREQQMYGEINGQVDSPLIYLNVDKLARL